MPKISIYVPKHLKDRMDDQVGVNWSALAQETFDMAMRTEAVHMTPSEFRQHMRNRRDARHRILERMSRTLDCAT